MAGKWRKIWRDTQTHIHNQVVEDLHMEKAKKKALKHWIYSPSHCFWDVFGFFLYFWEKVSLCSPGWPWFFFHLSASASKGFEFRHTSQDPAMGTISHASCVYMVGHTFQRTVKQLNLIGSELYLWILP